MNEEHNVALSHPLPAGVAIVEPPDGFFPSNLDSKAKEFHFNWEGVDLLMFEELDLYTWNDGGRFKEVCFKYLYRIGGYTTTDAKRAYAIYIVVDEQDRAFTVYLDDEGNFRDSFKSIINPLKFPTN